MDNALEVSDPSRSAPPPFDLKRLVRERNLTRGETLFRQGDRSVGIYEIVEGRVRLSRLDPEGRDIVLHTAGPGNLVADIKYS